MSPRRIIATAALGAALLAACSPRPVELFGEWRGEQPGPSASIPNTVDLTLEGGPDARQGRYHISTLVRGDTAQFGGRERDWGGDWVREDRAFEGRTLPVIRLLDPLPSDVALYVLAPDGTLHALDPDGRQDDGPRGALYTLSPVRPGPARGPG